MAADYKNILDWDNNPALQTETFTQSFVYDAMNRPTQLTKPDGTIEEYTYNKAGLLETIKAKIRGAASFTNFVSNINYNEKGQRTEIYYGNNTKTKYEYDAETFRLTRLLTTRNAGADKLQDINYTYDPVGNITEVVDAAQQTHYFNNTATTASGIYTYDALYRLKTATGRELTSLQLPSNTDFANNIPVPNTSANAMQNYTQQFQYDELGNIEQMKSVGTWTRDYYYDFANNKNYLLGHTNGTTEYTYDKHGNTLSMPHLTSMIWDNKDQLKEVNLGGGGTAYYVYDSSGERVRKVIEKTGGIVEERIYLGGYEVYRKTISGTLDFERQTLHLSDGTKKIASIETKTVENGSSISSPVSNIRYQYDNHLGSASLELDENAAIISYEEYHPFGTTSYRSGRTETEVSLKRYRYCGKEKDSESGLYYYGARYYAPWTCRFISADPLANNYLQLSPYVYVANNSLKFIDPDGRKIIPVGKKEVKHLNTVFESIFGKKSGFRATKKGVKFDKKKFDKAGFEGDKLELAERLKEVVTNEDYETYFKIGSEIKITNQIGTKTKMVDNYIRKYDRYGNEQLAIDSENPKREAEVPILMEYTFSDIESAKTIVVDKGGEILKRSAIVQNIENLEGKMSLEDTEGNPLMENSIATTVHEMVGHLYDLYTKSKDDTAVETENKGRKILGLKQRSGKKHEEIDMTKFK